MWPGTHTAMKDTDLYVGAVVPIHKRSFELKDADEFTYQYMENNPHTYPVADPQAALQTLRDATHSGANHIHSSLGKVHHFRHAWQCQKAPWVVTHQKGQRRSKRTRSQEDA